MLILTRRSGESIFIGDDIEIVIKEVGKNQVRVGINAPKQIPIRRKEAPPLDPARDPDTPRTTH